MVESRMGEIKTAILKRLESDHLDNIANHNIMPLHQAQHTTAHHQHQAAINLHTHQCAASLLMYFRGNQLALEIELMNTCGHHLWMKRS